MPTERKPAYLFPGQGAQYPGIGKDLHAQFAVVRDTYTEASDALGYDIAALSFDAPADEINRTRHTQPVLLTHSIACLRAFEQRTEHSLTASMAAGHSLGEYSALVAAGALSFAAALRLVKRRGELMGEYGRGEMRALMLDFESAQEIAGRHYCGVAACNLPEQTVVGGAAQDLDAMLRDMAVKFPKKRSFRLQTEGAFHTYHMVEAAARFRETLAQVEFHPTNCRVLSNFTGDFHEDGAEDGGDSLRSRLFLQLFNPVRWHENLLCLGAADAHPLIEFGGGLGGGETAEAAEAAKTKRPALEGMVKKTWGSAASYFPVINVRTLEDAARALAAEP